MKQAARRPVCVRVRAPATPDPVAPPFRQEFRLRAHRAVAQSPPPQRTEAAVAEGRVRLLRVEVFQLKAKLHERPCERGRTGAGGAGASS